ncbi:hypothetical protein PVK06_023876 [Gossypium arboreum]|uniref:Uncharacterized protein n=1 Tax=Gossypium arboreum TaxID=29729 RepID=A0ABR0PCH8_GOSAR|nr:hypothetical protein PVK06_023876 [Gossypium arboreum]
MTVVDEFQHGIRATDGASSPVVNGDYQKLLNTIKVNPKRAVVVATNLSDDKQGLGAHIVGKKNKVPVRSMKHIPLRKEWKLPQLEKPTQVKGMIRVVEVTLERKLKGEFC